MSRIIRCTQQSDLWLAARVGRITGSRLGDLMATPTTKASNRKGVPFPAGSEALAKSAYRKELVVERIYRRASDHYVTRAMEQGAEREPYARMFYEADTMQVVEQVGFALHPTWDWFGCSADGLCGDGGVELKCPTNMVHDEYAADPDALADEYKWQCLGCMICFPECRWWDLCSFNPDAPDKYKLVNYRFHRETWEKTIAAIEYSAMEMNEQIEVLIEKRGLPPSVFDIMPEGSTAQVKSHPVEDELGIQDSDLPQWYQQLKESVANEP